MLLRANRSPPPHPRLRREALPLSYDQLEPLHPQVAFPRRFVAQDVRQLLLGVARVVNVEMGPCSKWTRE